MSPHEIQSALDELSAIASYFLDVAEARIKVRAFEDAMKATHVAAWMLRKQNRELAWARVESCFQTMARELPQVAWKRRELQAATSRKPSWLHVITEALPHGGHTVIAARWMHDDPDGVHSVALLAQKRPVPSDLSTSVGDSGGQVHIADVNRSFLGRAEWLRKLAFEMADYVVLHIDMDDVIAPVAFGCVGGPPVLFLNHAAHVFWTGASVVDLAVNCRGSELETHWTKHYRGIPRCATVPIPLVEQPPIDAAIAETNRVRAREMAGVAKDDILVLTSGDSYKYSPVDGLDFVATCEDILRASPSIRVMALGANEDNRWKQARERTHGRIKTVGRQPRDQVAIYLQAADIYVEGFPFGSTTALLEAGLQGLPAVLAPVQCPPPYGTDGVAVDEVLQRATTIEEYKSKIIEIAANPELRSRLGAELREAIRRHHSGEGWKRYIENVRRESPADHAIHPPTTPPRTPVSDHEYWTRFHKQSALGSATPVEDVAAYALSIGLRPPCIEADGLSRNGAGHVRARILSAFGDRFCGAGDLTSARDFYQRALKLWPQMTKVRAKRWILSLGKPGERLWNGISAFARRQ